MAGKQQPATATQRVAEFRRRNAELGIVRFEVYAHPDDQEAIKELAKKLTEKRKKKTGPAKDRQ